MAGILIVADHVAGRIAPLTAEMVGAAVELRRELQGPLRLLLIGDAALCARAAELAFEGIDEVLTADVGSPHFDPLSWREVLHRAARAHRPRLVLAAHNANGTAFAPAVAARLGAGFAGDVFGIRCEEGEPVAIRGAYGNRLVMEVDFPERECVVMTLRGAAFPAVAPGGDPRITALDLAGEALPRAATHIEYLEAPASDIDIGKAEFILAVGRGIGDSEHLPRFAALAERLGATLGCSRPIVDAGWLPKAHQVGQSGKVATSCKLYLALGISGAVQHLYGMKHVETIIAVNTDPGAPIFNVATYGATVNLFELADALEKEFPVLEDRAQGATT